jgi:hypothetical protein
MYAGTVVGGLGLLPVVVDQKIQHFGGSDPSMPAKPLKPDGARPPLRLLSFHHWSAQKVTLAPDGAL